MALIIRIFLLFNKGYGHPRVKDLLAFSARLQLNHFIIALLHGSTEIYKVA